MWDGCDAGLRIGSRVFHNKFYHRWFWNTHLHDEFGSLAVFKTAESAWKNAVTFAGAAFALPRPSHTFGCMNGEQFMTFTFCAAAIDSINSPAFGLETNTPPQFFAALGNRVVHRSLRRRYIEEAGPVTLFQWRDSQNRTRKLTTTIRPSFTLSRSRSQSVTQVPNHLETQGQDPGRSGTALADGGVSCHRTVWITSHRDVIAVLPRLFLRKGASRIGIRARQRANAGGILRNTGNQTL